MNKLEHNSGEHSVHRHVRGYFDIPTPRADGVRQTAELINRTPRGKIKWNYVAIDMHGCARTLERENAKLREENERLSANYDEATTDARWLMLECDGWRARAERAEHIIKQLINHRGHVAADAVMDKMEREFSSANSSGELLPPKTGEEPK
jgi:hypothetical protein